MSEYTSKEISEKIKGVGIELEYIENGPNPYAFYMNGGTQLITNLNHKSLFNHVSAYTAQQAFEWLRENEPKNSWNTTINIDWVLIDDVNYYADTTTLEQTIGYKTTLSNMLWSAIIWIKENE